jgi:hypothetical protein
LNFLFEDDLSGCQILKLSDYNVSVLKNPIVGIPLDAADPYELVNVACDFARHFRIGLSKEC